MLRRAPSSASEWTIRLSSGPLSRREERDLAHWLSERPERVRELEEMRLVQSVVRQLDRSDEAKRYAVGLTNSHTPRLGRSFEFVPRLSWRPAIALATSVVLVLVAYATIKYSGDISPPAPGASVQNAINQISSHVLPDQSEVTLAADSSMRFDFTSEARKVYLDRGEAFFEVQHDTTRPFIVIAGDHAVTVTGTKFNVNYLSKDNSIEVAVVAGHINVSSLAPAATAELADKTAMSVGEVILFPSRGPIVRKALTPERVSAWRDRRLNFDGTSLSQVLAEVNRYTTKPLISSDPYIDDLTLNGSFKAGDTAALLFSLQRLYGINASDIQDHWLLTKGSPEIRQK